MSGKKLYKEINNISDDIIEEANNALIIPPEVIHKPIYQRWYTMLAAGLCLPLIIVLVFSITMNKHEIKLPESTQIFASDIIEQNINIYGVKVGASTKAYFTKTAESLKDLMKSPVKSTSDVQSLTVYQPVTVENYDVYFQEKLQTVINNAKKNLDINFIPQKNDINVKTANPDDNSYVIIDSNIFKNPYYHYYSTDLISDEYKIWMDSSDENTITYRIWNINSLVEDNFRLSGEEIAITLEESEESIKDKLSGALSFANKMFNTNFEFRDIIRNPDYLGDGYVSLFVEAYEPSSNMNQRMYNQYLNKFSFYFSNSNNDKALKLVGIYYTEHNLERAFPEDMSIITLEEAEGYLHSGYIFTGHVCTYCMLHNNAEDFENYDDVEIVYRDDVFGKYVIPFYAFYKKTADYTYAVAYVPAVAVGGLKEYFEEQEAWHINTD
ncbi:MAG: hypothetical protein K0R00_2607 [Herbinix sp.]|jgi:hypothetical protein|nr:hypothetical protein [Herbinix sp.]